jgi:hypothetical protein
LKLVAIAWVIGISVTFQIPDRCGKAVCVIVEQPKSTIALGTQQPTNDARGMAVIYSKKLGTATRNRSPTDSAPTTLSRKHLLIILYGDAVLILKLAAPFNSQHVLAIADAPLSVVGYLTRRALGYQLARTMGAPYRKNRCGLYLIANRAGALFHGYASKIGINSG